MSASPAAASPCCWSPSAPAADVGSPARSGVRGSAHRGCWCNRTGPTTSRHRSTSGRSVCANRGKCRIRRSFMPLTCHEGHQPPTNHRPGGKPDMPNEVRITQPTIRDVRGRDVITVDLGDGCIIDDDLEGHRTFARDYLRRMDDLAEIRRAADLVRSLDRPTIDKLPTELTPGDDFFVENIGWRHAQARVGGGCHFEDMWGETAVLTTEGIVYLSSEDPVRVAVPECEGSAMEAAS